jgi:hypothetical protein
MGELSTQFDYEKVKELVPKDDCDFKRKYEDPAKGSNIDSEVQQIQELWDGLNKEIEKLNREYAIVNLSGNTVVLHETTNPITGQPDVEFSKVEHFHHYHANQLLRKGQKDKISISRLWFVSPLRRQYQGVIFNPDPNTNFDGYYNLYHGFGVEPQKGDWSLMRNHIKEVVANDDPAVDKYIMAWSADVFQNAGGQKPGVALVLRGLQGVGKGAFASNLGKIAGNHYIHVSDPEQFTGRFNSHLKDKLLVFVDEGLWAGNKALEGKVKAYITEEFCLIEPKGVNSFPVKNHMRFIIASNNDWVVPAGLDERRMFVLDVNPKYQRNHGYFKKLFNQMDAGGREAMLYDLLEYDYSKVNLKEFPRTEALLDQMLRSASITHRFWFEKLMEGCLMSEDTLWTGHVSTDLFYDEYIEYSKKIGRKYTSDKRQFGKELKQLCTQIKKIRPALSDGTRQYEYAFPDLDECRIRFEEKVNMEIDWNELYDQ